MEELEHPQVSPGSLDIRICASSKPCWGVDGVTLLGETGQKDQPMRRSPKLRIIKKLNRKSMRVGR